MVQPVSAFMLSLLAVRRVLLKEQFESKFPGAWLVWEPGVWQPPKAAGVAAATLISGPAGAPGRPATGDALCFQLPSDRPLRLGRVDGVEIVINDATVSRAQLTLMPPAGGSPWSVIAVAGAGPVSIGGKAVPADAPQPLRSGERLQVGNVDLTFYNARGFALRLEAAASSTRVT